MLLMWKRSSGPSESLPVFISAEPPAVVRCVSPGGGGGCRRLEAVGRRSVLRVSSSGRRRPTGGRPRRAAGAELRRSWDTAQPGYHGDRDTLTKHLYHTCRAWRDRCHREPGPASSGASPWPSWQRKWRWRGWRSDPQWAGTCDDIISSLWHHNTSRFTIWQPANPTRNM